MIMKGQPHHRTLIFEGNSLMNYTVAPLALGGHYIPTTVYNNVRAGITLCMTSLAVSGRNQTQINSSIATNIIPYVKPGDVIVVWEGTNDMYTNALSGADAYANILTYAQTVRALGCKIVVCTVIARDFTSDPADLMDRIAAYNTLVRNNSSQFDAVCDLAAEPEFDTRADASNTTYYNADKIHQASAGQTIVINEMTATLETVL